MNEYEIKSVKIVSGKSLNPRWNTPMQVIETDKGVFIDNLPKEQFGFFNVASPGYNWKSLVSKKVANVQIFHSRGYDWINMQ